MSDSGWLDASQLRRLIDASRTLVSHLDLDVLLEELLSIAATVTDARYAALGILDEDGRELERFLTHGIDAEERREIGDPPHGRGILGVFIDDPRPLRLSRIGDDPRSYGLPPGHAPRESFLGAPVLIRGRAWGNLYVTGKRGGDFSDADEEVVAILAEWAGIAIENARHFRASEHRRVELERTVRRLEATITIARAIGRETDLDRVLELIATRSRALVEAHGIVILLREPAGLLVAATAGQVPHSVRGAQLELPEDATDDALRAALTALEVQTSESLVVPLRFRGRSVGMLVALGRTGDAESFADEGEDLLSAFAASAATAVATARSVEAQRLRDSVAGAESERGRWAREPHDETLQGLGGLRILISAARRHDDADATHETFDELVTRIDAEIDGLRSLIRELRPAALDELGPGPAIEELAERVAARNGLEVKASLNFAGRHPAEVETTSYRIIQEALTNAIKHAGATSVEIEVTEADGVLHLKVIDDGTGFDPEAPRTGFGLMGMGERALLLGGGLEVTSTSDGTCVSAHLPTAPRH